MVQVFKEDGEIVVLKPGRKIFESKLPVAVNWYIQKF